MTTISKVTAGRWEHFSHDADIGVRGYGQTCQCAFKQVALALSAIVTDPASIHLDTSLHIQCESSDRELLLYKWLNALIFEMSVHHVLFAEFDIELQGSTLSASARGETVKPDHHRPVVEPKGATLTELAVERLPDGQWMAQCVIDV